jgi:hypothetical protein
VPLGNPAMAQYWATPAARGGIWAPGGVSSDGAAVFVATGNTENATTWGGGEGVIRFPASGPLAMSAFWAPPNWPALDAADADLGSAPILFDLAGSTPSKLAIVFGKDDNAYLLDRENLGGVRNALAMMQVTSGEVITAPALYTTATGTYVAFRGPGAKCTSGAGSMTTIKIVPGSPPTLAPAWCGATGSGSPIVTTSDGHADAIVWMPAAGGSGKLEGFDGDTGAPIAFPGSGVKIPNMRSLNSPIAAKGKIYVTGDNTVVAFKP